MLPVKLLTLNIVFLLIPMIFSIHILRKAAERIAFYTNKEVFVSVNFDGFEDLVSLGNVTLKLPHVGEGSSSVTLDASCEEFSSPLVGKYMISIQSSTGECYTGEQRLKYRTQDIERAYKACYDTKGTNTSEESHLKAFSAALKNCKHFKSVLCKKTIQDTMFNKYDLNMGLVETGNVYRPIVSKTKELFSSCFYSSFPQKLTFDSESGVPNPLVKYPTDCCWEEPYQTELGIISLGEFLKQSSKQGVEWNVNLHFALFAKVTDTVRSFISSDDINDRKKEIMCFQALLFVVQVLPSKRFSHGQLLLDTHFGNVGFNTPDTLISRYLRGDITKYEFVLIDADENTEYGASSPSMSVKPRNFFRPLRMDIGICRNLASNDTLRFYDLWDEVADSVQIDPETGSSVLCKETLNKEILGKCIDELDLLYEEEIEKLLELVGPYREMFGPVENRRDTRMWKMFESMEKKLLVATKKFEGDLESMRKKMEKEREEDLESMRKKIIKEVKEEMESTKGKTVSMEKEKEKDVSDEKFAEETDDTVCSTPGQP